MNIKTVLISLGFSLLLIGWSNGYAYERLSSRYHHSTGNKLAATGKINLLQANSYARTQNIFFTLPEGIKGVLRLYYSRANHRDTIRGEFILNSASSKKTHLSHRVIFKDKIGVVAQSKGDILLARGNNQKMKFGSIVLTKEDMRNINAYEIKMNFSGD